MTSPIVVCILGMHRSGTSLVARLSNLLGVHLGPDEHLVRPATDNPTGFWEHRPIVKLNEQILAKLGGNWQRVPNFRRDWQYEPRFDGLTERARSIVENDFQDKLMWGFKDPRTCLTLPFWQKILSPMRYVVCIRNPFDVARSLAQRDGLSPEKGVYLWLMHLRLALDHTLHSSRLIVSYERLLERGTSEVERLRHFLHGGTPLGSDHATLAQSFVNPALRHHSSRHAQSPELTVADEVYRQLVDGADVRSLFRDALDVITPEVERQEREQYELWRERLHLTKKDIAGVIPEGRGFILVDDNQWGCGEFIEGRRHFSFLEHRGAYWGPPPEDETAIRELERLRRDGATFLAVGWPSFWWLDHYREFDRYVRSHYPCVLRNDRLVVFDLKESARA